jgi:hypothetical protein
VPLDDARSFRRAILDLDQFYAANPPKSSIALRKERASSKGTSKSTSLPASSDRSRPSGKDVDFDVPLDDARSFRRAILDLDQFYAANPQFKSALRKERASSKGTSKSTSLPASSDRSRPSGNLSVDVPLDDARSFRRAILDLDQFYAANPQFKRAP